MSKIKLKFSIGYDSFVYKTQKVEFNQKYVGSLQLLGLLERELGLSGNFKNVKELQALYLEKVSNVLKNSNKPISESFKNDAIGVANELFKWREELKFSNWDFQKGISKRLDVLSEIEKECEFFKSISDRWWLVLRNLKNGSSVNIDSIEIYDELKLLHPIYKELFDRLKAVGVQVKEVKEVFENEEESNLSKIKSVLKGEQTQVTLDKNDTSFQIIKFKDSVVSSDFLAQQLHFQEFYPVIVNTDNYGLDISFRTFDMAYSGSKIDNSNPQIIQLFKLVSSLLFKRVNPYNLLSLFNLPTLPFSKSLALKLSKSLVRNGGIGGEDWCKQINDFKNNASKEELKSVLFYIERIRVEEVEKKDLIDLYRDISTWSAKKSAIHDIKTSKTQYNNLKALCDIFIKTVENIDEETFSLKSLDKIINKVYSPISLKVNEKQKGSHTVISTPSQLHNTTENLIWFDFYNYNLTAGFGDFLMKSEVDRLKQQESFLFWDNETQIQYKLDVLKKGILKTTKQICFFIADKVHGESTTEHPLYTNLSVSIRNFNDFVDEFSMKEDTAWMNTNWQSPKLITSPKVSLPKATDYINISSSELLQKRAVESFSSINDLIQNPFDWVLNYQAQISDKGLGDIDAMVTLKGNLSHLIVQTLLDKEKQGLLSFENTDINFEIDNLLEEFTPQVAAPFYLEENTFDFIVFTNQLKKSFQVLLEFISENELTYKESEFKAEGKINGIPFTGNVDLLFVKNNTPVIVDLKWTFSNKKYAKLLEEEKSIQLAMYAKLLENSKMPTAYFLLSHAALYTTSNEFKTSKNINKIVLEDESIYVNDRMVSRTINSIDYRWSELQQGKIELAEDFLKENIEYSKNTESMNLIPLSLDYTNKVKKENSYSNYHLFKGKVK